MIIIGLVQCSKQLDRKSKQNTHKNKTKKSAKTVSSNHFYNYLVSEIPVVSVCEKKSKSILKNSKKKTNFKINILRGKTTTTLLLYPDFLRLKFFEKSTCVSFFLKKKQTKKATQIAVLQRGRRG